MRIALVGQPNSGKSTLFNSVAGYKSVVANYPGTTSEPARSLVHGQGEPFELVDLPGLYSLSSIEKDELRARELLLSLAPELIIHVIDASALGRSLELTFELAELELPLIVCLNMMDEAARKGIDIDLPRLAAALGVPVVPTVAATGEGVARLFQVGLQAARERPVPRRFLLSDDVERVIGLLVTKLRQELVRKTGLPTRLLALKLLERDTLLAATVAETDPELAQEVLRLQQELATSPGRPADVVLGSERHALCLNLFEEVATVRRPLRRSLRDRLDAYVMHPLWGYLILGAVLFGFFSVVFGVGRLIEAPIMAGFEQLGLLLTTAFPDRNLAYTVLHGLIQGLSGGIGLVLPYLLPFLVVLTLLEDVGYIPRAAFLMDSLMHKIGLHGKAIIPFVLGYGCTVPAIMSVRLLESSRDRLVTSLLVNFIPCAARTTVIFALVGFYLGPGHALLLYVLNLVIIALAGRLLLHFLPEATPGMILEVPSYRLPQLRALLAKVWYRMREFVVIAWPILIAGSVVLSLLEAFELAQPINALLAPFTSTLLGLPAAVGITLIFGVLRKELAIVMLVQALGTSDFSSVMTNGQLLTFTVFTIFYVPCLGTLAMLRSVSGVRGMLAALGLTTLVATLGALVFRLLTA